MKPLNWKYSASAVGVFLTVSLYSKISSRGPLQLKSFNIETNPIPLISQYYGVFMNNILSFTTLKLVNLLVVALFIIVNLVKWAMFGKLFENEVKTLKDNISYTIWEFFLGFLIFLREIKHHDDIQLSDSIIKHEFIKYSGLFFCIVLLKGFHFLSAERAYTISLNLNRTGIRSFDNHQYKRLSYGVAVITIIDLLLIYSFFHQMYFTYSGNSVLKFENNILVALFGFEIIHMFPLIFFTGIKFSLNYYEKVKYIDNKVSDEEYSRWQAKKSKLLNLVEFAVTFIRFGMSCVFAIVFLYFFTFPIHILPSSYISLRLLIIKTRCLISFERRNLKLKKLNLPANINPDSQCVICFDYLINSSGDGVKCLHACEHNFHYTCLKSWLNYSNDCPICRTKI